MLKNERQLEIADFVRNKKSMTVSEIAKAVFVSEATVRRDLSELAKAGVLARSHGGAFVPEGAAVENAGIVREKQNVHEKRIIAQMITEFLSEETTIFMDSSSSAGAVISSLGALTGVSVITNGIRNCERLMEQTRARVYLCPGSVSRVSDAVVGTDAVNYAAGFCADLCVISCGGISAKSGITEASREQAELKRQMIKNSRLKILLCDSSKFGRDCMTVLCGFDSFDYILSDTMPDTALQNAIADCGCEIITADKGI